MSNRSEKSTVTVRMSWFSSNPIFKDVHASVKREISAGKFLSLWAVNVLRELLQWNGGEPFDGLTRYGPHTRICFEAPSLAVAVDTADILEYFLRHEFPGSKSDPVFLGFSRTFAGKTLVAVVGDLEKAVADAQKDLKGTRRFFPSKKLQALRLAYESLHV